MTRSIAVVAGPSLVGIVNPDLLKWAREACSLDVEAAAKKIGTTAAKITEWEAGGAAPTITQLRKASDVYRRAVSLFFLDQRPAAATKPVDFRKLELSAINQLSHELSNGIREAQAKREAALDIFRELEEEPPQFALSIHAGTPADVAADQLVRYLGITFEQREGWISDYAALRAWRAAAEAKGVLVMQVSRVTIEEMRGCSLALLPLPVVLLNSSDRPLGRIFTLLHELAHLARRESALCDVFEERNRTRNAQEIEVYCNQVAGSALVPSAQLMQRQEVAQANARTEWTEGQLGVFRRAFWASREVVLRQLLYHSKTSRAFYQRMRDVFQAEYARMREQQEGGFVAFPRKVVLGNGRFLTDLVVDAYDAQVITGSTLSRILGTKLDHLENIKAELRGNEAA